LNIPVSQLTLHQYKLNKLREKKSPFYTLPFSDYKLHKHALVDDADIIHLHWIAGFIDYPSFFKNIEKPIVWTLHDENLFLGGFHYRNEMEDCSPVYDRLEEMLMTTKQKNVAQSRNLTIIDVSKTMKHISLYNPIVRNRNHHLIPNSVDYKVFRPFNKTISREILNLPENKKIIAFVSLLLFDRRKGFTVLIQSLTEINRQDLAICAVGKAEDKPITPVDIHYAGFISDPRLLSLVYSAADLFVLPSLQEAFAQTPLEALACGTPVVAFPCGVTEELINERNGIRTKDFTVLSLKESIQKALEVEYDNAWLRRDVISRFAPEYISSQYVNVYRDLYAKE
jgi:glycosyltransferase involved in cell wall biosynthesis